MKTHSNGVGFFYQKDFGAKYSVMSVLTIAQDKTMRRVIH